MKNGEQQIEVPDDAHRISMFLVDRTGDCLVQLHLSSLYETYGKAKSLTQGHQQAIADLAGGERDNIEYKPFMEPKNAKEVEFLETVIAFANTYGGKIYVGVANNGIPQGEAAACRALHGNIDQALLTQMSRLKELVREMIKPVPEVNILRVNVRTEPIIVVEVKRGNNPPYATHQNQIFVRKGSTNRTPDPSELRTLISNIRY